MLDFSENSADICKLHKIITEFLRTVSVRPSFTSCVHISSQAISQAFVIFQNSDSVGDNFVQGAITTKKGD